MGEEGGEYQILPFYFVVDVSYSMDGDKLAAANKLMPAIRDAMFQHATVADMAKVGLIDFADDARVVLPLSDLRDVDQVPTLTARGGTSYAAAFTLLRQQIESDYAALKADNFKIKRTAVVFISDGEPTDEVPAWQSAHAALTDYDGESKSGFRLFPNLIAIGIGSDVNRDTLDFVRHRKEGSAAMPALITQDGANPAGAIVELIPRLVQSVVNSAAAAAGAPDDAGVAASAMADALKDAEGFDVIGYDDELD